MKRPRPMQSWKGQIAAVYDKATRKFYVEACVCHWPAPGRELALTPDQAEAVGRKLIAFARWARWKGEG